MATHHYNIACLLASGLSSRFGEQNKLLADFNHAPMIAHAAKTVCDAGFDKVYAVVNNDPALHKILSDFNIELIINERPKNGQSQAIKLIADKAISIQAKSLTIALGDMPFITTEHLINIQSLATHASAVVSNNGTNNSPPVLFSAQHFNVLAELTGDQGALTLLNSITDLQKIQTVPDLLRDIDTPQMLKDYS